MKMEIKYPKGFKVDREHTKLAVKFPDELFKGLIKQAKKEEKNLNDWIIELIHVGKFDIEESDRHEPKRKRA
jgi:hypothetical protein